MISKSFFIAVLIIVCSFAASALLLQQSTRIRNIHLSMTGKGFARDEETAFVPPSSLYKKRKPVRNGPQQSTSRSEVRALKKIAKLPRGSGPSKVGIPVIHSAQLCSCGSGVSYSSCCGRLHAPTPSSSLEDGDEKRATFSAEQVLRARYTAYKHGLGEFIVQTSHVKNEDYEK